jgi:hypothetical protein
MQAKQIHVIDIRNLLEGAKSEIVGVALYTSGIYIMKKLLGLGLIIWGSVANAQNAPVTSTATQAQGQARQLGILVGGTATEYDLCVKKGLLAKSDQSAEDAARSTFEKLRADSGPEQSAYVQEGWDMMKKEISAHESFYTQEKCTGVGKEWAKIMATMRKK